MFCYQCQQTAKNTACTVNGVCGKDGSMSDLQDQLTAKLIVLCSGVQPQNFNDVKDLVVDSLFVTITNVNFDHAAVSEWIDKVDKAMQRFQIQQHEWEMTDIWEAGEDIRSLKSLILLGLKGTAAYAHHAKTLGYSDINVDNFFITALSALKNETDMNKLLDLVIEAGHINLKCMELLDKANTQTYGIPSPVNVTMTVEKGPFIVVTGHDLYDLQLLLEQTKDKGVNIYTHGEMLPCHSYPELNKYKHLKGNFGTAWQNQQKEFKNIPAPVLFTTNCIMTVQESYRDRIFTTSVVGYPGMKHIEKKNGTKDFSSLIAKAVELGGYSVDTEFTGINGGNSLLTGFGHDAILSEAENIIKYVKNGDIKHFFLVGGCDGAAPGRNYYTEFVKKTPSDAIVLTLACGKYRFNDINCGNINGIPRLLDMGQCNDAYGAIKVATKLAEAFKCNVNQLPLTLVLSWYEQKAVCILLTLLALGIKNMYLGPTIPAFISPAVLKLLQEKWQLKAISDPEKDIAEILKEKR